MINFQKYKGLIIDVWGVLHDGESILPGAQEFLNFLEHQPIPYVMLTNSPRRVSYIEQYFQTILNFSLPKKAHFISCGELIYQDLKKGLLHKYKRNESKHLNVHVIDCDHVPIFDDMENIHLTSFDQADMIFFASVNDDTEDHVQDILAQAQARYIPILCANPDTYVYQGPKKILRPGALLENYKGPIIHYGKPHGRIYAEALRYLKCDATDVLSIGDNPLTDGKAALNYGLDFCLIYNGLTKTLEERHQFTSTYTCSYPSLEDMMR